MEAAKAKEMKAKFERERLMLVTAAEIRQQKMVDEIFECSDEDGKSDTDTNSKPISRTTSNSSGLGASDIENVEDAFEDFRKNHVEEDTRIALAIIQGIADYAEFKPQEDKKLSRRQQMKQYVINAHMVRLCIMRCFHPHKLYTEIKSFITYFLGRNYTDVPPFEFNKIYN